MIAEEGSFRETLHKGWLTSAIMLETLSQMTGDLTDEQLAAMGYNEEQIQQIQQFAALAMSAATEYKTFTEVSGAIFEVLGSGWANVWETLIGDYETAKAKIGRAHV